MLSCPPFPAPTRENLMVGRRFAAWLRRSLGRDTGSTDPTTVPSHSQSQSAFRSFESTPKTLQRRKSDGEQSRSSIQLQSVLTVSFGRDRRSHVSNPIRFPPSPPRSQCRSQQTRKVFERFRRPDRCTREQAGLEVDFACLGRTRHRRGEGLVR